MDICVCIAEPAYGLMNLPEELLLVILRFIPLRYMMMTVSAVSKDLYRICHLPVLWRKLSLRNVGCIMYSSGTLYQLFHRHGQDYRHVYFGGDYSSSITSFDAENALSKCVNLTSLDIGTNGFLTGLSFLRYMPMIRRLILDFSTEIDRFEIVTYIQQCHLLEELSMYRCTQLTFTNVRQVVQCLPQLKRLNLEHTAVFNPDEIQSLLNQLNLTDFACTPVPGQESLWRALLAKYPKVTFNEAITTMSMFV